MTDAKKVEQHFEPLTMAVLLLGRWSKLDPDSHRFAAIAGQLADVLDQVLPDWQNRYGGPFLANARAAAFERRLWDDVRRLQAEETLRRLGIRLDAVG
jgi:hypothetical protein